MTDPLATVHRAQWLLHQLSLTAAPFDKDQPLLALRSLKPRVVNWLLNESNVDTPSDTGLLTTTSNASIATPPASPPDVDTLDRRYIKHASNLLQDLVREEDLSGSYTTDLYLSSIHYLLSALHPSASARLHAQVALAISKASAVPVAMSSLADADTSRYPFPTPPPSSIAESDEPHGSQPTPAHPRLLWTTCSCGRRNSVEVPEISLSHRQPDSTGDRLIAAIVFLALWIKHSPIPHLLSHLLHLLLAATLVLDAHLHIRQALLLAGAAALERLVRLDRELGLHRRAADAAGWAFEAAVAVLVALVRADAMPVEGAVGVRRAGGVQEDAQ